MRGAGAVALVSLCVAIPAWGEDFDPSAYEKKAFEWKGYAELKPEEQFLRRDSAGYLLQLPGESRSTLERLNAAAELSGILRYQSLSFAFTGHTSYQYDSREDEGDARLYEAYGSWQPGAGAALEVGKRSLRWGKGYAWNPVAFLERAKDPTDPELSREGFVVAGGELIQSFSGSVQTLALTAILLPTTSGLNEDFGPSGHLNFAFKLYGLVFDTDVDLIYTARGSQGQRFGVDFSRNLGSNLEVHGEWARTTEAPRMVITAGDMLAREPRAYHSYLLGLRYLTEREATFIVEYYRNGGGYTEAEMGRFFELVRESATDPALSDLVRRAASQGYSRPNAMRDYVYFRAAQQEPFDILYFTPALTAIVNIGDRSFSIVPEATYTGINNLELRLRLAVNWGQASTEYREKAARSRLELRARYYF